MNAPTPLRYLLPAPSRAAIERAVGVGLDSLRALPPMHLSDWAAKHFRLAGESSQQRGGWEAWPFQIGMLDAMSNDDIAELDVFKSKRVGYTKALVASIAFDAAHRRRNQALWQPTDDDRDSFVKSEIEPLLDPETGLPALLEARRLAKGTEDTIKYKQLRSSVIHLLGGKAARAYRRITVAAAKLDEIDGFDQQIEKSSDPVTLAEGRLEGAPFPKLIIGSTPRVKGLSHVEHRAELAVAFVRYHITCMHCGVEHPLIFGGKKVPHGLKWESGRPETVHHVCPHCRGSITQADYLARWRGAWVCERTGIRYDDQAKVWTTAEGNPTKAPRHLAMHVWAAYSPQREWVDIARQCIAAARKLEAGDTGPMQGFVNETLGQTWEPAGEKLDEHELQRRAEDYPLCIVPKGGLVLTAGADLQGNRLELGVWAWGFGMESWDVDHVVIEMNPASDDDWATVEQHLLRRYPQAWHGGTLGIEAVTIDSNYQTQAVFNFVRRMQYRLRIYAGRGEGTEGLPIKGPGRPQDVNWRGQRWPQGIKQWSIGVDSAKDLLHGQLQIQQPGAGFVHLNKTRPREWFEQLSAEHRIPAKTATGTVERWVKRRPRNEVLDTRNYALHAAYMLGMNQWNERRWRQEEAAKQPPPDLFTPPPADAAIVVAGASPVPPAPPPAARRPAASAGRSW